ncbi:MAG: PKD domain-containing protein [Solirubrobacteraceae bacterium]
MARRFLKTGVALACVCAVAVASASVALASPGWSAPSDFALPGAPSGSAVQIGYQAGGTATVAYIEVISFAPLETVVHVGAIAPGGSYQEQLRIASSADSIPSDVKFAEAPDGAAVLQWSVLEGSDLETAPLAYLASYRAAGSSTWEAPATIASDATQTKGISSRLVPAISANGTAAAGVEHLDSTIPSPGGHRIDVAVHSPGGSWGAATQISPPSDSSEGLVLGFDANGDLTAAFRLEMANTRHTLDAVRRPASSGVWGSLEDVTGSDVTSDVFGPTLGVSSDGSAVIAFQYVHNAPPKTLDVNAVTRNGATGSWTAPVDVALGGTSSGPIAVGVSPTDKAYVLYSYQGGSSAEDCVGVVRASAGGDLFSTPQCVSPTNFQPGGVGAVAFLGNDAYFAWSGEPSEGKVSVAEGSRWLDTASQPDSFTNLDAPAEEVALNQLVPDQDGSVAAFWTATEAKKTVTKLRAAAYDAGGPNLLAADVPVSGVVDRPVALSASFFDLWSGLGEAPSWSFGDGSGGSGAQVSHTYAAPGTYTVTVTARDGLGNQTSSSYSIEIFPSSRNSGPPRTGTLTVLAAKVLGKRVVVQLRCTGAVGIRCAGVADLVAREELRSGKLLAVVARRPKSRTIHKTVGVGATHFTLGAGQTLSISVALNATGSKLLARFGKLPVTLTVATTHTKASVTVKHLRILRPKHRAKGKKH